MRLTEFFRLRMPDGTDPVNIEDFNDNFEVIDRELKKRISDDGSASDVTVGFEVAESRQPLKSGEKLSVLMGKAHRFFTDLKTVAFSGKYGDLIERPTLGGAAGYKVADNDTTNSSEFLSTARVAYEHGQEIDALSRDLGQGRIAFKWEEYSTGQAGIRFYVDGGNLVATLPQWTIGSTCQITYENGDFYGNYNGVKKKLGSGTVSISNYIFNFNVSTSGNGSSSGNQGRSGKSEFILNTEDYETLTIGSYKIEGDGAHAAWNPRDCVALSVTINGIKTTVGEEGHTFDVKNADSATIVATFGTNGNPDYGTWATLTVSSITLI